MKVKLHLLVQREKSDDAMVQFSVKTFNAMESVQQNGTIPVSYQQIDTSSVTKYGGRNMDMDPNKSFRCSPNNQNLFTLSKTFTKTLGAGEEWFFDHKHYTGPGIRMDQMINQWRDATDFDVDSCPFYTYVFEVCGLPCELIKNDNPLIRYTGTAAGALHVEGRKYFKVGLASENDVFESAAAGGGFESNDFGYRIFTAANPSLDPDEGLFFVRKADIKTSGVPGKYHIPVATDVEIKAGAIPE
jgi:hypothetical protein